MNQSLAIHRLQLRQLSIVQLIIDVVVLAAVGMLAMFVLLLASFQNFDALFFESGLRYDSRAVLEQSSDDGLVLTVTQGTRVMSERRFDDPDRWSADFNGAATPIVWSYAGTEAPELETLLGSSALDRVSGVPRVFLDRATAAALAVSVGDGLVLSTPAGDLCRVQLEGVTRSYKEVGGSFTSGLLIVPRDACPDGVTTWTDEGTTYLQFDAAVPSASSQSWGERMLAVAVAAADFQVSGLLPVILLVGLGLWTVVALRSASRIRQRLAPASDLLFDLGCRPSRIDSTYLLVTSMSLVLAALGAAWGAHEALWRMASFSSQPQHWISVALLFSGSTITIVLVRHLRARRRSAKRPSPDVARTTTATPRQGER